MRGCRRLRVLLISVVALAGCAHAPDAWLNPGTEGGARLRAPSRAPGFTVAIIGDQTNGDESSLTVLARAVEEINLLDPDLVLHIGDIVPGYKRDMADWQADVDQARAILAALRAPFFPVPGNHDVITGAGDTADRRGENMHARAFGPLFYSFDHRDTHFVCLYSDEERQSRARLSRAQMDWLRDDLAAATASQVFVFMHKPLWDYEDSGWEEVHELLTCHPVRAVFAGHYHHYYKAHTRDGIQHYVLGATGGKRYSPEAAGGLEHYSLLRILPGGYRLTLVRPGAVLGDDFVMLDDFRATETLRFQSERETGIAEALASPDGGPVDDRLRVRVHNPLDRPLSVSLRGLSRGAGWDFGAPPPSTTLEAGATVEMSLPVHAEAVRPWALVPPDVEVCYEYVDRQGRRVPIALRRRVPLHRRAMAAPARSAVVVDGLAEEPAWADAAVLTTAVWRASAYETGQPEPTVRILSAPDGLYLHVEAEDACVSDFRGEQVLCDALFVAAAPGPADAVPSAVVLYPFGDRPEALLAPWHERRPQGVPADGVRLAALRARGARAWSCEAFVPWRTLLGREAPPGTVRFNVGVWDNDGDLFTELHTWAPTAEPALWGLLEVASAARVP